MSANANRKIICSMKYTARKKVPHVVLPCICPETTFVKETILIFFLFERNEIDKKKLFCFLLLRVNYTTFLSSRVSLRDHISVFFLFYSLYALKKEERKTFDVTSFYFIHHIAHPRT